MKLSKRIYGLLALLLVGSVSLQAQNDPFPDNSVPSHNYQGSMTITAQIVQNGAAVTNAVVAVYCGNEFRGKKAVGTDNDHPSLVYLMAYGDSKSNQYLYFKVYMGGQTFTYNPDPAITFVSNTSIGKTSEPYVITLPVSIANNADNSSVLTTYKGQPIDVVLTGRTLYKDGAWNTLCLPFPLTADEVNAQLAPSALMTLSSSDFDNSNARLTLNFKSATAITAGKPYIIRWTKPNGYEGHEKDYDLAAPVFTGVTIPTAYTDADAISSALGEATVPTSYVDFVGTYSPVGIYTTEHTKLYLGADNTLYCPTGENYKVNACRAYFLLKNGLTAGEPTSPMQGAPVRSFVLNFGNDEMTYVSEELRVKSEAFTTATECYDLQGRRIANGQKPTAKGIYIVNGRKIVIK